MSKATHISRYWQSLLIGSTGWFEPAAGAQASAPANVSAVIARYRQALGNKTAVEALKTQVKKGTGFGNSALEVYYAAPDHFCKTSYSRRGTYRVGTDGQSGWIQDQDALKRRRGPILYERLIDDPFLLLSRRLFPSVRFAGRRVVDKTTVDVLVALLPEAINGSFLKWSFGSTRFPAPCQHRPFNSMTTAWWTAFARLHNSDDARRKASCDQVTKSEQRAGNSSLSARQKQRNDSARISYVGHAKICAAFRSLRLNGWFTAGVVTIFAPRWCQRSCFRSLQPILIRPLPCSVDLFTIETVSQTTGNEESEDTKLSIRISSSARAKPVFSEIVASDTVVSLRTEEGRACLGAN
jgi:hypothetical protein